MLLELVQDYPVLVPGEVIERIPAAATTDAGRRDHVTVYPAGLYHIGRMAGLYSAVKSAADEPAATAVLLGDAFPLLATCCAPRLTVRDGPLAELAAASWLRQSAERDEPDPRERHGRDRKLPPPTFSEVLATLVAGGHRVADVLHVPMVGVDGRPLPYPGWTVPALVYYWRATARRLVGERAEAVGSMMSAIVGTFGDDNARQAVDKCLRQLRAFSEGPKPKPPGSEPHEVPGVPVGAEYAAGTFPRMSRPPRPGNVEPQVVDQAG